MASSDINELLPCVRVKAVAFDRLCDETFAGTGTSVIIVCTYRSALEQELTWLQGRMPLDEINAKRKRYNLPPIGAAENVVRTRARPGDSAHQYRCAFDALALEHGKIIHSADHPVYKKIGEIGESCGLQWSGRWKRNNEAAHFQYLGGLTIDDLRAGQRPGFGQTVAMPPIHIKGAAA